MSFASLVVHNASVIAGLTDPELKRIMPLLQQAASEQNAIYAKFLAQHPGDASFSGHMHRQLLGQLNKLMDDAKHRLHGAMMVDIKTGAVTSMTGGVARLAKIVDAGIKQFGSGTPLKIAEASLLADEKRWLSARWSGGAARYAGRYGQVVRQRLAVGALKGESVDQVAKRLLGVTSEIFDKMSDAQRAKAIANRTLLTSQKGAERLVRTENAYAANQIQVYALVATPGGGWMKRWDATFDRRTCGRCRGLDGETVLAAANFSNGLPCPPDHPYCRCCVVPWHPAWNS